ncbi:hypothetical protein Goklo_029158, partial [Gossypium klotzschianum]|nr:hypothetical protein [Gossypium klotzschianum]
MIGLNIEDGEEELLLLLIDPESQKSAYEYCLVGCFLMTSIIHFSAMRNTMMNLWHFLGGVQISDLGEFFSEIMAKQLENFIGRFLVYDTKQLKWGIKNYLKIRVELDVTRPLKRRKKIM